MNPLVAIVVMLVLIAAAAALAFSVGKKQATKEYELKVGSAETRARAIIDDAVKTAETKKREALLEAKEEALKNKNEFEKEQRERRRELQQQEQRLLKREENADRLQAELSKSRRDPPDARGKDQGTGTRIRTHCRPGKGRTSQLRQRRYQTRYRQDHQRIRKHRQGRSR